MKRYFFIPILFLSLLSFGQDIPTPHGYKILAKTEGDLNKDGIPEKVIVFDTNDTTEVGTIRDIHVYKRIDKKWQLLTSSKKAIGKSEDGGMMGDPFEGIEIRNGVLLVNQSGGSSWKWFKTDKYRLQNGIFQLIGYTSNYGKPCEYFEGIDFNILTGKIVYEKEFEDCEEGEQKVIKKENETFYKKGIKIDLNKRTSEEVKIITPKYKNEIYL